MTEWLYAVRAGAYKEQAAKLVLASGNAWEAGEREAARWLAGQAGMCHQRAAEAERGRRAAATAELGEAADG